MLMGVAAFFTVSLGGLLIGIIIGALTALITKFTKHVRGRGIILSNLLFFLSENDVQLQCLMG